MKGGYKIKKEVGEQLVFLGWPQGCKGHWEEWECRDKDYQWRRNADVLLG